MSRSERRLARQHAHPERADAAAKARREAAERERRVREAVARVGPAEAARFGWEEDYGMLVSKEEGERRRREAMEQARQQVAEISSQYEAARANGAPGDAEYDRMTAIAPPPDRAALHRAYQAKVPDSARARALLRLSLIHI